MPGSGRPPPTSEGYCHLYLEMIPRSMERERRRVIGKAKSPEGYASELWAISSGQQRGHAAEDPWRVSAECTWEFTPPRMRRLEQRGSCGISTCSGPL